MILLVPNMIIEEEPMSSAIPSTESASALEEVQQQFKTWRETKTGSTA